jgi:hypothetical protein
MARPTRTERDKIAAKARKLCPTDASKAEWRAAWQRVFERLPSDADTEIAREAMLRACVEGRTVAEAEELAFRSVVPLPPLPY